MHLSLRGSSGGDMKQPSQNVEDDSSSALESLHRTVEGLFQEEEALLNLHMNVIQENAELLTEEGRLLQQIQGEDVVDYDIGLCIRSFLPLYQVTLVCCNRWVCSATGRNFSAKATVDKLTSKAASRFSVGTCDERKVRAEPSVLTCDE